MEIVVATSYSDNEANFVTETQHLQLIQDYLMKTSSLHFQQAIFLEGIKSLSSSEKYETSRTRLQAVMEMNTECARNALAELQRTSQTPILVHRLSTGETAMLRGLGISDDPLGYIGHIAMPDRSTAQWVLDSDIQLSLK
jgi:hypothetical protein